MSEHPRPDCLTPRTEDAELVVASLTARAPSASQSEESEMNGAESILRVCDGVDMVPKMRSERVIQDVELYFYNVMS